MRRGISSAENPPSRRTNPARGFRLLASALGVAVLAGVFPQTVSAETQEELHQRIFGKSKAPAKRAIPVSILVNGRVVGDAPVLITNGGRSVMVAVKPFVAVLEALVDGATLATISALAGADGRASVAKLDKSDLSVSYDPQGLKLVVKIPARLRRVTDISLRSSSARSGKSDVIGAAGVSAYVNFRTSINYVHSSAAAGSTGRQPLLVGLDGAVAALGGTIEMAGAYREAGAPPWQRGNVRVVHDDVARRLRYSIGDLAGAITGFQAFQPMAGISLTRNFRTRPDRPIQPSHRQRHLLARASTVEVMVNGRVVETLRLGPGPIDLRDFPVSNGANDITLRITDDLGRREIVEFPFFFDSRLLATGLHDFGYSLGVPRTAEPRLMPYDTGRPVFSAFHRLGITDTVTVGANLQGNAEHRLFGVEALYASPIGTFGVDAAASRGRAGGLGAAIELGYRLTEKDAGGAGRARNWNFSLAGTSRSFTTFTDSRAENPVSVEVSGRVSQPFAHGLSGGIGARYRFARGARSNAYDANLFVRKRFDWGGSANLSLSGWKSGSNVTGIGAMLTISIPLGRPGHSVRSTYDTRDRALRVDWQYRPENEIGGVGASLGFVRHPDAHEITGALEHRNGRFEADLAHDFISPRTGAKRSERRSRLALASAIVFADGHVAISRPVSDSFALVIPHSNLAGQKIGVEPRGDTYLSRIDWTGPAVVPNLVSYEPTTLVIEAPELPFGYDLGNDRPKLMLPHRSGALVRVGTDASVLLGGTLLGKDGAPLGLKAGEVRSAEDAKRAPVKFFTNRRGRFRVDGLRPGRYKLHLYSAPRSVLEIEIPAKAKGLFKIGKLRF